jgi:hypothetical protein
MYDSRDDQEMPTTGLLSEASIQLGGSVLGADYGYQRITLINTHYWRPSWPLAKPYVLVTRAVFENLF